ncbi:MAG: anti-sigma factor [Anaerolineae bacterium]
MHTEFTELMSLALDHEADATQMAVLQKHLAECAECAATWEHWQMIESHISGWVKAMPSPTPGLAERVMMRLDAQQGQLRRQHYAWLRTGFLLAWLGIAAVLLLVLAVGAWWGVTHPLQTGIMVSACTRLLSSTLWSVREVQTWLVGVGVPLPWLMASYFGVTIGLFLIWVWLLARPAVWRGATDGQRMKNG